MRLPEGSYYGVTALKQVERCLKKGGSSIYDEENTEIVLQYATTIFEKTRALMESDKREPR